MTETISKRLRRLREEKKRTLADIKEGTGINEGYISKLERGIKKNPTMDIINKLADYYNVTVDYLMGTVPFKNKTEAHHSISMALVKSFKENPEKIPSYWETTSVFDKMIENNISKEVISYCESLFSKFEENQPMTNIELMELSSIMFANIKWSSDYDKLVYFEDFYGNVFNVKLDFEKIEKITLDLSKSYLFKIKDNEQFELEQVPSLFNIARKETEEKTINKKRTNSKELTEEDILSMAAHKTGHQGNLSPEELEKIKLAIKIALAKNN